MADIRIVENFSEWMHLDTIRNEGKIYTACGNGRTAFVSSKDIAEVVIRCLIDEKHHPEKVNVVGPELLTYDQVHCPSPLSCLLHTNI
jgi:festuclavine dehydrogenase